ncbi:MAG TPA: HAMP domain-containing sensor histidine kinase [Nitrososphaera sp.]|nr:HAMP domain-containing sensor histidine kinase [Nitrososphaera sp.]
MYNTPAIGKDTEVVRGVKKSAHLMVDFLYTARTRLDMVVDSNLPPVFMRDRVYRSELVDARERGVAIRIVTEVTKENLSYCKGLAELCDLCHIEGIKANFGVSEFEYLSTGTLDVSQPIFQVIHSNTKEIVEQQEYVFESFWNRAVPARTKIAEIEEGRGSQTTEVIESPERSLAMAAQLMQNAKEEVLVVLSTPNAFRRAVAVEGVDTYRKIIASGARLRMLVPADERVQQTIGKIRMDVPQIEFSYLDKGLQTGMSLLLVDKTDLMVWEMKDDTKDNPYEAMGRATYSNSTSLVLSLYQIYGIMWKQAELYENIKMHNRMQSEFVNIAAHEIRTPVQPILGMADIIEAQFDGSDKVQITRDDMALIVRNARRLERLTSDILEVTRIESGSVKLNRVQVDLNEEAQNVAKGAKDTIPADKKSAVQLVVETAPYPLMVNADKSRLYEVVSNLLSNSIKFTEQGSIVVRVEKKEQDGKQYALVTVRDPGAGIDLEIMPRMFTKFASKSERGTGLGLFIAKSIIEAHGGRIWGENNTDGKGVTFAFMLPLAG